DSNDARLNFDKIQEPRSVSSIAGSCWSKLPVGWSVVVRDAEDALAKCISNHVNPMMAPNIVEVYAVREALIWLQSLNIDEVILEVDCLQICNALMIQNEGISEFGMLV
ncbi:hypothetical protein Godav_011413, partial [Gossypium davidsonii]|nr:hypothetical protein [Gossypium davidsonii]